jgi:uncharacterized protein (TIGR02145 family)
MKSFIRIILIILITTSCKKENVTNEIEGEQFNSKLTYGTVTDIEGNIYKTIEIGCDTCSYPMNYKKTWMAENLRTKHFQNGDQINQAIENTEAIPEWCYYKGDSTLANVHGLMYNYYIASDSRNVCPSGWHVPKKHEWLDLLHFIDASTDLNFGYFLTNQGGVLKSTGTSIWEYPNGPATNLTGFSAIPSGFSDNSLFSNSIGYSAEMWIDGDYQSSNLSNEIHFFYWAGGIENREVEPDRHISIRCIKD